MAKATAKATHKATETAKTESTKTESAKTAKATKATTDVLALIEADHEKVEQLFEAIESAKGKKIQSYFEQIYKEMTLHAKAEELVFYPALQEYEQTAQYIEEAEEEHNATKILLEQMLKLPSSDDEFQTKLEHLKGEILHHVEEEESEIFSAVRECMDEAQLQQLGQEFQEAKAKLESEVEEAMTRK